MWWRLAFPIVLFFVPRLIPSVVRRVYLLWKLVFDARVPLLLKLLLPGTLLYFVLPLSRVPYLGPAGYLLLFFFAAWLLINLAPRNVVDYYAPWRARSKSPSGGEKDPSKVVEASYHVVDEDKKAE